MKAIAKYYITLGLAFGCLAINAQQLPQFTQYYQNMFLVNPAATGAENYLDTKFGYRQQWSGVAEAPKTLVATINGNLNAFNNKPPKPNGIQKHGFGLSFMNDNFGMLNQNLVHLHYSQHYKLTRTVNLSAGIMMGYSGINFNSNNLSVNQGSDETFNNFLINQANTAFLDGNAGLMVYNSFFQFGYSVNHLFGDNVRIGGNDIGQYFRLQHQFHGGVKFTSLDNNWDFMPGFLIRSFQGGSTMLDVNVRVKYQNMFWAGLSYRNNESVGTAFGILINNQFNLSYSYDFAQSNVRQFNTGSHEVLLGINLNANNKKVNQFLW